MNIAIVTTDYLPNYTGASVRVNGITEGLVKNGDKVIIITFKNEGNLVKKLIDGVTVYRLPYKKYLISGKIEIYSKFHIGRFLSLIKNIKKIIENEKINLLHVRPQLDFGFVGLYLRKKYKLPLIIEMHRFFSEVDYEAKKINKINALILNFLEKYLINKADGMVVLTQTAKKDFSKSGIKSQIIVVPNSSNLKNDIKIKSKENKKYLIYTGMLRENERLENLLYAFKEIKEEIKNIYLYITGDGEEQDNLINLAKKLKIEDSVKFFGKVSVTKLKSLLAQATLFVHPRENIKYHTNFIGLKFYDAINFGLPILTYDVGEVATYIKDKKIGIVTEPNPSSFAKATIHLLKNKNLYNELKKNVLKESKKSDWKNCTINLHNYYKTFNVISKNK
ncbi:glycosyltransferase family 4 protein [Candidatus Woesearchaeota archaeon]|nr:glycosyltransferase family 4 protein [Candidatus Woesearchaeota archaeon]